MPVVLLDRTATGSARKAQRCRRAPQQLGLAFRSWGGRRPGAGRPKKPGAGLPHRRRPALASRFPVHLGLKVHPELPSLRRPRMRRLIEQCLRAGKERFGFRLVHYSIQHHHLHLIAEAPGSTALARGTKGLVVRLARGINRELGRRGRVFIDRYFERVLKSPREVHDCLRYVLLNEARHTAQRGTVQLVGGIDPCSSGRYFDGWRGGGIVRAPVSTMPPKTEGPQGSRGPPGAKELPAVLGPPVTPARTYLLRHAWRSYGLLAVDEIPGIGRRR